MKNSFKFYYLDSEKKYNVFFFSYWKNYQQIDYASSFYFFSNNSSLSSKATTSELLLTYSPLFSFEDIDENFSLPLLKKNNSQIVFDTYLSLRKYSVISFFINNMIDVPICFKKSSSLKTKNFELPVLKFINLMMWEGKKEKSTRLVFSAFDSFWLQQKKKNKFKTFTSLPWFLFYYFLNGGSILLPKLLFVDYKTDWDTSYNSKLINDSKFLDENFFYKKYLISKLSQFSPIFSFYIYNVDKNVRKFSRGKSGKYVFVWKYVAAYKRPISTMRWIIKDIKFNNNRKINQRVSFVFSKLANEPKNTFAHKYYVFSHNYVFRSLRKTLMTSLRTTV